MESKTSSGQILIECALALVVLAWLLSHLLDFDNHGHGHKRIESLQNLNFSKYRNEK